MSNDVQFQGLSLTKGSKNPDLNYFFSVKINTPFIIIELMLILFTFQFNEWHEGTQVSLLWTMQSSRIPIFHLNFNSKSAFRDFLVKKSFCNGVLHKWRNTCFTAIKEWGKFYPKKVIQIWRLKLSTQISHVKIFIQKFYPKNFFIQNLCDLFYVTLYSDVE